MYREGLTAVHIYDRYVAKMRMSSLPYRELSYVCTYICTPMYVCKEKLTAGSGEAKMDKKKTKGNPFTFGRRGEDFSVSKRTPWKLPSITARRSRHLGPPSRTKDHANPPWIESISRQTTARTGNGPISSGMSRDFSLCVRFRAP